MTIDGPAGAGKSTVARKLADRLQFAYLDTGAMYRAVTFKALRRNVNLEDEEVLLAMMKETSIDFDLGEDGSLIVLLDREDVTHEIRSVEVTENTFLVARIPRLRAVMVERQREIGGRKDIVVEGRDTGTVVFPNAAKKFYLDADFKVRVARRNIEMKQRGMPVAEKTLEDDLRNRDHKDCTRDVGPLKAADDALVIDTTNLTIDQVVDTLARHVYEK